MKYFELVQEDSKQFAAVVILYDVFETSFGKCLVATADKGVVAILFADSKKALLEDLESRFVGKTFRMKETVWSKDIERYFTGNMPSTKIPLQLIGTPFQRQVWTALLEVKYSTTCDYGAIAEKIGDKKKSRAVGTAIGKNPIGYVIPCHRVLRSDGGMGGYRWGIERKKVMLVFESTKR